LGLKKKGKLPVLGEEIACVKGKVTNGKKGDRFGSKQKTDIGLEKEKEKINWSGNQGAVAP